MVHDAAHDCHFIVNVGPAISGTLLDSRGLKPVVVVSRRVVASIIQRVIFATDDTKIAGRPMAS